MAVLLNSESIYHAREATKYTYDWEINKYKQSKGLEIFSPEFVAGSNYNNQHCQWRLQLDQPDFNRVRLYLLRVTSIQFSGTLDRAELQVIVCIVTENGDEVNFQEKRVSFAPTQPAEVYFDPFVKTDHLFKLENDLVVNGKLTIRCRLYFFFPHCLFRRTTLMDIKKESIKRLSTLDNFEKLLEIKSHSDVKLVVRGEEFQVHKCILAAQSRVFSAMFEHDMLEKKKNIVEIEDVKVEVMKEVLRFVYASKVENMETMIEDLLVAADKYEIEALKDLCGRAYVEKLNFDNVGELLKLANTYGVGNLKTQALKYIMDHGHRVDKKSLKLIGAESVSFSLSEVINALDKSIKQ